MSCAELTGDISNTAVSATPQLGSSVRRQIPSWTAHIQLCHALNRRLLCSELRSRCPCNANQRFHFSPSYTAHSSPRAVLTCLTAMRSELYENNAFLSLLRANSCSLQAAADSSTRNLTIGDAHVNLMMKTAAFIACGSDKTHLNAVFEHSLFAQKMSQPPTFPAWPRDRAAL